MCVGRRGKVKNWECVSGILHGFYRFLTAIFLVGGVVENLGGDTPHRGSLA